MGPTLFWDQPTWVQDFNGSQEHEEEAQGLKQPRDLGWLSDSPGNRGKPSRDVGHSPQRLKHSPAHALLQAAESVGFPAALNST